MYLLINYNNYYLKQHRLKLKVLSLKEVEKNSKNYIFKPKIESILKDIRKQVCLYIVLKEFNDRKVYCISAINTIE